MSTSPARLALVHGPDGFADLMVAILASPDLQVRPVFTPDDIADGLASGSASVVVVDWTSLGCVQAGKPGGTPFVVVGCPDAPSVGRALAAGAVLGVRSDAGPDEIRSLVRSSAEVRGLARECENTRLDLERHSALLLKDDLTSAYNRRFFDRFLTEAVDAARAPSWRGRGQDAFGGSRIRRPGLHGHRRPEGGQRAPRALDGQPRPAGGRGAAAAVRGA